MKNRSMRQNAYSGIKITDSISLSLPQNKSLTGFIPLILIAFCGCFGTVNSFVSMFHIDISFASVNFYTALFFLFFSILYINQKSISGPLIPIILIYEFFLYRKWDSYLNGLMLVCNQVYQVIFPQRGDYFRINLKEVVPELDMKTFIAFTIFLLCAIICCICIIWPDFFFGFTFTFPIIEIGLYNGKTPDIIPAFMLIIYWTSLLAVHHSGYYRSSKRMKTGFIRKGSAFLSKPAIKFNSAGQTGITMMAISAIVITGAFIFVNVSGYTRSENLNTMRSNVKTAVSEFSFDDISGSLERLSASFGFGSFKTNDHRLGNLNSVSYSGATDLTVTVDKNAVPNENIYLKGYVGSVYDGKSWDLLNSKIYRKYDDLFSSFGKNKFDKNKTYPQNMLYETFGNSDDAFTYINMNVDYRSSDNIFKMTVEPALLNQKYCYTPYNSYIDTEKNDVTYIDDTIIDVDNKKKYSFNVSPEQDFSPLLNIVYVGNFNADYKDFVYANYLDVPNNDETEKLYNTFIKNNTYRDKYIQLKYIKKVLAENADYTLEPGKTPSNRDFVSYFLMENHKGYCVHFATAGVILARMSGIPARFAEGYVVLKDDLNESNLVNDEYKIKIKDERAHAWAEIYLDGYGWIPFEFTPSSAPALTPPDITNIFKTTEDERYTNTTSQRITQNRTNTTSVSTTVLPVTGNNGNGNNKNGKKSIDEIIKNLSPEEKLLAASGLMLILTICIIIAVHYILTKKRENSFNTSSNAKNAINAYNYIVKLLDYCNIKNNNMQYLEFADFAEQNKIRIFKSGELTEITQIALEAGLSGQEITEDKAKKAVILSYKTAVSVFRKQNFFGKLYMKFIKNLC